MSLFHRRHGERIEIGGVKVRLSVNPRARRISLRIDRVRREAVAIAPSPGRLRAAVAFARERRAWLEERLADLPDPVRYQAGDGLLVFGEHWRLTPDGRRPVLMGDELHGCGLGEVDSQLVARAVKKRAREVFAQHIAQHCAALSVGRPRLIVTDPASRWGSCTPARRGAPPTIRLSWRLALAPPDVAEYVAAHEACHLIEPNHGADFWTLVRLLVGDERPSRNWLRTEGASLHAF